MIKRIFDLFFAVIGLLILGWLLLVFSIIHYLFTGQSGLFVQERIGQYGKKFKIYKLRTINTNSKGLAEVTVFSNFLRKSKIDELPQLYNIVINDMSFVGPRPDIQGYYDELKGDDRKVLELKPGITGLASLKYSNEELILALQNNPEKYNDEVIFPDKVKMNLEYQKNQTLWLDIKIIFSTFSKIKLK